ncbi:Metallo-dependent hydrolase [Exidia glandulosa HHB12029]|uniref:Metallo-dependent hydrolase n=1 Tax=Exidia glandulosa HHB12029 TaxID=1314781 RepID=A0A165J0C3_EXIGL|nr:Metallo-dependent hydrolase [Exidia glandulosa HHB12029]
MSTSPNGLLCFTNCLLVQEDGSLAKKDLWIDERSGTIVSAQRVFYSKLQRPARTIDLGGNILSPGLIDIQLNGAYGFDFSVYEGDDQAYLDGLKMISSRIVETGVTSLLPTIITQERKLYPKLLSLLAPTSAPGGAHLLGWHVEGPFLQDAKRGAHSSNLLLPASEGIKTFEDVYGAENLQLGFERADGTDAFGVKCITAAPEVDGVLDSIEELIKRGVVFSIGHSTANSVIATRAVTRGARLITHLFNAMPQLHHRDPCIIGLLGASFLPEQNLPHDAHRDQMRTADEVAMARARKQVVRKATVVMDEATVDLVTPPHTPTGGQFDDLDLLQNVKDIERPYYGLIVDGIHSHPNSVRLAYSAHPKGCVLVTDAQPQLDPNLKDGAYEWRYGKRLVKEGHKLYIEGTDTLAGSVIPLGACVRNFAHFTGATLAEAIVCATLHPAQCLGIEKRKGTLRAGADADLAVLDRDGYVIATWVRGRQVWTAPSGQRGS